ncbi:hypothetical protein M758_2G070600 [Ceratodon purpureus]|uniref:Uncharacterized protein n=1 Tax=Ceratodon purpureus TaxID=3225 RepID=A0A8T0IRR4_CERPU|nr:hypothetical protein KC19_2G032700 [Ceratodon purpureus]KAG0625642.1 hypothetical protein M758_2G070600 [Ceratodon purpureus]
MLPLLAFLCKHLFDLLSASFNVCGYLFDALLSHCDQDCRSMHIRSRSFEPLES